MQLHYDAATEKFRAELREWLERNRPTLEEMRAEPLTSSAHLPGWSRRWQRRLFDAGLLVPGWPPELGGRSLPPVQQLVYHEEMAKIGVMRSTNPQGLGIIAPSILDYGSDFLKQKYLLPTLRAEIAWCLGMSEPGAGSDLAALSTRAELHGDHFVVTGQKIWTSGAHHADHCFCFVRTDPDAPKHRGISVLIIDMKAPGIRIRPLPELFGREHVDFAEVFFDGVSVPRDHLVGPLNQGWAISAGSLAHERGMMWLSSAAQLDSIARAAVPPGARNRVPTAGASGRAPASATPSRASTWTRRRCGSWATRASRSSRRATSRPSTRCSSSSAPRSRSAPRAWPPRPMGVAALDVDFHGWGYDESSGEMPWMQRYLQTFGGTISAGASEIQRNIIAQRVLGLPRR